MKAVKLSFMCFLLNFCMSDCKNPFLKRIYTIQIVLISVISNEFKFTGLLLDIRKIPGKHIYIANKRMYLVK